MADRMIETKNAIDAGAANGWVYIGNSTVRRTTTHATPQFALDAGWYTGPEYDTHEFLSFVFGDRNRVPKVVYGVAHCAWTGRSDSSVSFRRAKELLAQPLADSDVHDRD